MSISMQTFFAFAEFPAETQLSIVSQADRGLSFFTANKSLAAGTILALMAQRRHAFELYAYRLVVSMPDGLFELTDDEFAELLTYVQDSNVDNSLIQAVSICLAHRPKLTEKFLLDSDKSFVFQSALRQPCWPSFLPGLPEIMVARKQDQRNKPFYNTAEMMRAKVRVLQAVNGNKYPGLNIAATPAMIVASPTLHTPGLDQISDPHELRLLFQCLRATSAETVRDHYGLLLSGLSTNPNLTFDQTEELVLYLNCLPVIYYRARKDTSGKPLRVSAVSNVADGIIDCTEKFQSHSEWVVAATLLESGAEFDTGTELVQTVRALIH